MGITLRTQNNCQIEKAFMPKLLVPGQSKGCPLIPAPRKINSSHRIKDLTMIKIIWYLWLSIRKRNHLFLSIFC